MKVISTGPFIGDFKTEILDFIPFVNWLYSHMEFESFFVSSHFNRSFLYTKENLTFFPVYECLSRDELKQNNNLHDDINLKEYTNIKKDLKSTISKYCSKNRSDVLEYFIQYSLQNYKIPFYQKLYLPINFIGYNIDINDFIVYIPDKTETEKNNILIYEFLKKKYKHVLIVGDLKTHILDENVIMSKSDYFRNGYKWILSYLQKAKLVICPGSFWTVLCNQQKYKVLSWSKKPGLFKEDGEYNLENENCHVYLNQRDIKKNIHMLNYFTDKLLED